MKKYNMKKLSLLVTGLVFGLFLGAQNEDNLVPNPSFEDIGKRGKVEEKGQVYLAAPWTSVTMNPVDLYSENTKTDEFATPRNERGEEKARTGTNYAGVNFYGYKGKEPRNYLGVELLKPMEEGKEYCVKFHISMSDMSKYAVNNIGVFIDFEPMSVSTDGNMYEDPHVVSITKMIYEKQFSWTPVCGTYLAEGGEKFIVIGNFAQDADTKFETVRLSREFTGRQTYDGYYYVDDVSVIPTDKIGDKDCACERVAGGQMKTEYKTFETNLGEEDATKAQKITIVNSDGSKLGDKPKVVEKEDDAKTVEQGGVVYKKANAEEEVEEEVEAKVYSPNNVVIYYDSKEFQVPDGEKETIDELVKYLKENKSVVLQIQGHADPSESSVSSIGKRRSALLRVALTKAGVPATQLKMVSLGITKLVDKGDASKNQRVTFKVL
ncbi:MAG: outer membrane protein OmpA-like peptidoglycan-associated protein [Vicingaceae bacterium]